MTTNSYPGGSVDTPVPSDVYLDAAGAQRPDASESEIISLALFPPFRAAVESVWRAARKRALGSDERYVPAWGGAGDPRKAEYGTRWLMYQHRCGHVECLGPEEIEAMDSDGGGCDACESGEPDGSGWKPLYRMADSYE